MDLRFIAPALSALDDVASEILACSVWQDVRPCEGVAALCDWRLAGRISALLRDGFLRGEPSEVLLVPGRPRLGFDKILLFGAGARDTFDEARFRGVVEHMLRVVDGLCARLAVVELPGRAAELIGAERAVDLLLEAVAGSPLAARAEVWTLVESDAAARRISHHVLERRRRVRRARE
jgi:hypothetical protein